MIATQCQGLVVDGRIERTERDQQARQRELDVAYKMSVSLVCPLVLLEETTTRRLAPSVASHPEQYGWSRPCHVGYTELVDRLFQQPRFGSSESVAVGCDAVVSIGGLLVGIGFAVGREVVRQVASR